MHFLLDIKIKSASTRTLRRQKLLITLRYAYNHKSRQGDHSQNHPNIRQFLIKVPNPES